MLIIDLLFITMHEGTKMLTTEELIESEIVANIKCPEKVNDCRTEPARTDESHEGSKSGDDVAAEKKIKASLKKNARLQEQVDKITSTQNRHKTDSKPASESPVSNNSNINTDYIGRPYRDLDDLEKAERKRLLESALAEPPYDDVLIPDDYPDSIYDDEELKIAVARAREKGMYVALRPMDAPGAGIVAALNLPDRTRQITFVSKKYLKNADYTYRDIFNHLYFTNPSNGCKHLYMSLSGMHNSMTVDELADETMQTILRVSADRLNRIICHFAAELHSHYNQRLSGLTPFSIEAREALETFDREADRLWTKLMQYKKITQK